MRVTNPVLNALGYLIESVYRHSHDSVMKAGETGLSNYLRSTEQHPRSYRVTFGAELPKKRTATRLLGASCWSGSEERKRSYDLYGFTAARPYLPFGTKIPVSYDGRSAIARRTTEAPTRPTTASTSPWPPDT